MKEEDSKTVVDSTATSLFHLTANMVSRANAGEEFSKAEILAIASRLQDHAADLQLAASRLT